MKAIRLSLTQAAAEFGTTRDTIRKGLHRLELLNGSKKKNQKFTIYDLHRAIAGDLKFERTRHERAEADRAEVAAARERGEVIHVNDVTTFIRNNFGPVREDVIALPGQLAAKCNPENPELARQTLTEWVDVFIKRRRENLP